MLTDDTKFWDSLWYISEFPVSEKTDDDVYRIVKNAQLLMRRRAQELRERGA